MQRLAEKLPEVQPNLTIESTQVTNAQKNRKLNEVKNLGFEFYLVGVSNQKKVARDREVPRADSSGLWPK